MWREQGVGPAQKSQASYAYLSRAYFPTTSTFALSVEERALRLLNYAILSKMHTIYRCFTFHDSVVNLELVPTRSALLGRLLLFPARTLTC